MSKNHLCLNMIVKSEMANLERCLGSIAPYISCWVICDTGSSDGTQEFIKNFFKARRIPGQLHEFPFVNFQETRNRALRLALTSPLQYDYILLADADMELRVDDPLAFDGLWAEVYKVLQKSGVSYWNSRLVKRSANVEYRGVTHEFLDLKDGSTEKLSGAWYVDHASGANRVDKYERDEKLIRGALASESDPGMKARYTFYLANTLRDSGKHEAAILEYQKRAELGGWIEERFVSLYNAAKLMEKLSYADADVIGEYAKASVLRPGRAEALHGAARFCRVKGLHEQGYELATRGLRIPRPRDGLFVHDWIYETGLWDEYAINAYWAGHYVESLDACLKLLQSGKLNTAQVTRIAETAARARDRLGAAVKPANLGRFSDKSYVADHRLDPPPPPRNPAAPAPRVLLFILAEQMEVALPLYLKCIEELDYPKCAIVLYIRTNNNKDNTEAILREWVARVGSQYAAVEVDDANFERASQNSGVDGGNAVRFKVLGRIRNISLQKTLEHDCAFYFVCDVGNFIRPCTLWELVNLNLPIVAPLLRSIKPTDTYSNYHAEIDANGYYVRCDQYLWLLNRWVRGVNEMPVVHSTYLVRRDVLDPLTYIDDTKRHEYVVFSHSARKAGIPQYFDNRHIYGYLASDEGDSKYVEGGFEIARKLMSEEQDLAVEVFSDV